MNIKHAHLPSHPEMMSKSLKSVLEGKEKLPKHWLMLPAQENAQLPAKVEERLREQRARFVNVLYGDSRGTVVIWG